MVNSLPANNLQSRHSASIAASLAHRLEVAKATNNFYLVSLLEREKRQLEAEAPSRNRLVPNPIARLSRFWQQLKRAIAHSTKLHVWQTVDSYGVHWWNAYNPHTGQAVCTDSESEMRQWIEKNYQEN